MSERSSLRSRDFRLLLLGQTASHFGAQLGAVAFLLIGLPAGVWIDRVRRKPILVTTAP